MYFVASSEAGREIWRTDGTEAGTLLIKDINPRPSISWIDGPKELTPVNNRLYFLANDGDHGRELWKSDGTAQGTMMVKNIASGPSSAFSDNLPSLFKLNNILYFPANNGTNGEELWRSDGTEEGTFMVADILPGQFGSYPTQFRSVNGSLYFVANDGVHGEELWRYDPTAIQTNLSNATVCAGATLSVKFASIGTTFNSGNVFTVELSDANGSFASPKVVGTFMATVPATITATIPADLVAGNKYRIRVNASNPATKGGDNGSNIIVHAAPLAKVTADGFTLTASEGASYRWFFNNQPLPATTRAIQAMEKGDYAVEVTNVAGCSARSAAVNVQVTGIEEAGQKIVSIYPNPGEGRFRVELQSGDWTGAQLTVKDIQGKTIMATVVAPRQPGEAGQLDLTGNSAGMYLVVLQKDGKALFRKIIKK